MGLLLQVSASVQEQTLMVIYTRTGAIGAIPGQTLPGDWTNLSATDLFYPFSLRFFEPHSPPIVFQGEAGWSEDRSSLLRLIMTMKHQPF